MATTKQQLQRAEMMIVRLEQRILELDSRLKANIAVEGRTQCPRCSEPLLWRIHSDFSLSLTAFNPHWK